MVRLGIPRASDRGQWVPTMVAWNTLVPITVGRVSPRGLVSTLVDRVLLDGKWSDNDLGTHQHRDQCSDYPASTPNLARPQGLCPGMTLGLAVWGPTPTRKCCSAKGLDISSYEGGMWCCVLSVAVY